MLATRGRGSLLSVSVGSRAVTPFRRRAAVCGALVLAAAAFGHGALPTGVAAAATPSAVLTAVSADNDINKIDHIVVIMQENRSFDNYFGMYPGADGFTL